MTKRRFHRHDSYRALLTNPRCYQRTVGLISCKVLREKAEYIRHWQSVVAFLADARFRTLVRERGWHLAVTGGTYDCIPNNVKSLPEYRNRLHGLAPSALGVIQIANLAVYERLVGVAFFNHMEDLYADSPQNLCLRRICNHFGVPLLEDISSIEYVFQHWPERSSSRALGLPARLSREVRQYYGEAGSEDAVFGATDFAGQPRDDRRVETLGVVAHDGMKMSMLSFCLEHASKILAYRRVISTGTTGSFLRNQMAIYLNATQPTLRPDAAKRWGWDPRKEKVKRFLERKIQPFESGPKGGDVQISAKVIDGTCHRVLFFQDPQSSHPHQFDIRLMEKAVQDPETAALFATSVATARIIV